MPTPLEFIRSNRKRMIWIGVAAVALVAVLVVAWGIGVNQGVNRTATSKASFGLVAENAGSGVATSNAYAPMMAAQDLVAQPSVITPPVPAPSAGPTAAEVDQKIIKTGNLSLVVAKAEEAAARITAIATELKGFVQSSSVSARTSVWSAKAAGGG